MLYEHYWNHALADGGGGGGDDVMLHADSLVIGYLHHKYHLQDTKYMYYYYFKLLS
jgi:hypothetical protein